PDRPLWIRQLLVNVMSEIETQTVPLTEADASRQVFAAGMLGGTAADFIPKALTYRASMNARDISEELHVDLCLAGIFQMRAVVAEMGQPGAVAAGKLVKPQVEAMKLLATSRKALEALRTRKHDGLD